jgi:hypothetical protein
MKTAFVTLAAAILALPTNAGDFTHASVFESVNAFVIAASTFQPDRSKSDLAALFTVRELGQPDDPKTGKPVAATSIRSSVALWSNESDALVFVTATPATDATRSAVGVLFLLHQTDRIWRIADSKRFLATGKYADVSAEITAGTGVGYQLGSEGLMPVVTIKEAHGGRGYGYQVSASYTFDRSRLKRRDLE